MVCKRIVYQNLVSIRFTYPFTVEAYQQNITIVDPEIGALN